MKLCSHILRFVPTVQLCSGENIALKSNSTQDAAGANPDR